MKKATRWSPSDGFRLKGGGGKTETNEESAAPAPSATKTAGIAQQTRVLELANKLASALHKLPREAGTPSLISSPSTAT
jgi:hypothetical protein